MILVVGATGLLGREICRRLAERSLDARALIRAGADPSKVTALEDLGIEIAPGDLRDSASLEHACRGVDTVVSTVSAMPFSFEAGVNDLETTDLHGTAALIEAARRVNVGQFVYTSFSSGIDIDCPLASAKRAVEGLLVESGLPYTILRPSYFLEVWLSPVAGFDFANAKAAIYGGGDNPISWIAVGDVAEFAVRSLSNPAAMDRVLELGGPEPLSPRQVVAIFERGGGRPFELQFVSAEDLAAAQQAAPDAFGKSFAALQRSYAKGDPIEMGRTLASFGVGLTSVADYASLVLGAAGVPVG